MELLMLVILTYSYCIYVCLCYCRMVDIEVQTQSQVIQADSEGEADPTYSPSYLSGDDDIYVDDETRASFMSKKKAQASVQPPSDEDNEQSESRLKKFED